jgi:hypothetical protein
MLRFLPCIASALIAALGCSRAERVSGSVLEAAESVAEEQAAQTLHGPADPPYGPEITYPSGLRVEGLVRDATLSASYPSPAGLPFGSQRRVHYVAPEYFLDLPSLSPAVRDEQVTADYTLQNFVWLPDRNGDDRAYIDSEIVFHVQQLKQAWGRRIVPSSTFRGPRYNRSVGGATFSRHMYGDAVDINIPDPRQARDFYNLARVIGVDFIDAFANTVRSDGSGWIHIDDRGFRP